MLPGNMHFSKPVAKLPRESKDNQNQFAIADSAGAKESALEAVGGSGRAAATPAPSVWAAEFVPRAECVPTVRVPAYAPAFGLRRLLQRRFRPCTRLWGGVQLQKRRQ